MRLTEFRTTGGWGRQRERINRRRRSQDVVLYDHSTPWRCGEAGCVVCDHKPSYGEYMSARVVRP